MFDHDNKQTSVIIKSPDFLAGQKEGSTTMVEINISVKADGETRLRDILDHIVNEITDEDYRLTHMNDCRKVDLNWVYMDEGRYQWQRSDRT